VDSQHAKQARPTPVVLVRGRVGHVDDEWLRHGTGDEVEFVERGGDPQRGWGIDDEFVVSAALVSAWACPVTIACVV
jgi:hypothetical protein